MTSLLGLLADQLDPPEDRFAGDAALWVKERLGEHLWSKQIEVARSVQENRYTAVHACHDVGKSHLASRIVAHWLDTHPPGSAFVVTTAPTFAQVRAILWRYIGQAHRKGGLVGTVNQTEWHIGPELVAYGRKPADRDPAAFQGIHAKHVLVVIDEACGVTQVLWDAVDALVPNDDCRVLAIGNPDDPQSHFAEVCKADSGWTVIHIDGLQTPNFTDEDCPAEVAELLMSPTWEQERRERWGVNSPLYVAKVRGLFPVDTDDTVVPMSWATRCQNIGHELGTGHPVQLGFDVGAGGDAAVIVERRGATVARMWETNTRDPEELVTWAVEKIDEVRPEKVKIDAIGIGWGIGGGLRTEGRRDGHWPAEIVLVNVGAGSFDSARFPRLRDQVWWELGRELCEPFECPTCGERHGSWDLSQIDDLVVAQLTAPKYGIDASGRIKVEPKDETRSRIGRSPDHADALLLSVLEIPDVDNEVVHDYDDVTISNF